MKKKLKNKVVFINGASGGIGEAISYEFARMGSIIVLIGRNKNKLLKINKTISKIGAKSEVACGYFTEHAIHRIVKKINKHYNSVDYLINCAGTYLDKSIASTTLHDWNNVLHANLTNTFMWCRGVIPFMKKQKNGSIVNFSSVGGKIGLKNKSAYCASKFGVVGLSKSLSKELKTYGIKVHIVYPYLVDSHHEIRWQSVSDDELSIIKVEDIAELIIKLVSLPKRVSIEDIEIKPYLF